MLKWRIWGQFYERDGAESLRILEIPAREGWNLPGIFFQQCRAKVLFVWYRCVLRSKTGLQVVLITTCPIRNFLVKQVLM